MSASKLGVLPPQAAQPGDGVGDRVGEDPVACGALASTQRPDPAARLGQIDEAEIEREGADDGLRRAEVEAAAAPRRGCSRSIGSSAASERDRPLPDPFHEREQLGPGLLRDDLAEQGPKQPDLDSERVAGTGRPDPERLGGDAPA